MSQNKTLYENPNVWDVELDQSQENVIEAILDHWPDDAQTVLDVGCGDGKVTHSLISKLPKNIQFNGYDISQEALSRTAFPYKVGSATQIEHPDNCFDIVMSIDMLEHLNDSDEEKAWSELFRVSKEWVYVVVPFEEIIEEATAKCKNCKRLYHVNWHMRSNSLERLRGKAPEGWHFCGAVLTGGPWSPYTKEEILFRRESLNEWNAWKNALCPHCDEPGEDPAAPSKLKEEYIYKINKAILSNILDHNINRSHNEILVLFSKNKKKLPQAESKKTSQPILRNPYSIDSDYDPLHNNLIPFPTFARLVEQIDKKYHIIQFPCFINRNPVFINFDKSMFEDEFNISDIYLEDINGLVPTKFCQDSLEIQSLRGIEGGYYGLLLRIPSTVNKIKAHIGSLTPYDIQDNATSNQRSLYDIKSKYINIISSSQTYPNHTFDNAFNGRPNSNYTAGIEGENSSFVEFEINCPSKIQKIILLWESIENYSKHIIISLTSEGSSLVNSYSFDESPKSQETTLKIDSHVNICKIKIEFSDFKGQNRLLLRQIKILFKKDIPLNLAQFLYYETAGREIIIQSPELSMLYRSVNIEYKFFGHNFLNETTYSPLENDVYLQVKSKFYFGGPSFTSVSPFKKIIMLCHDQTIDRRIIAQAQALAKNQMTVIIFCLSFDSEDHMELFSQNILIKRIGLSNIIPENNIYKRYIFLLNIISKLIAISSLLVPLHKINWITYKFALLLYYRNRSICDPLPFDSALYNGVKKLLDVTSDFHLLQVHDLPSLKAGKRIASEFSLPLVYDAHELYPEQRSFSKIQKRLCHKAEFEDIQNVDLTITVNESIATEMAKRYNIPKPKVILNAIEAPTAKGKIDPFLIHDKLGISHNRKILLLQGGLSFHRGLLTLVKAFKHVKCENLCLVFLGSGPLEDKLKSIVKKSKKLSKLVQFIPAVPQDELLDYTQSATMGIIPYPHIDLNSYYCTPNKLFEYIQAEVPIIANDSPELRRFVHDTGFGHVSDLHSPKKMAKAIDYAFSFGEIDIWKENIRQSKHLFSWEHESEKYVRHIKDILELKGTNKRLSRN